MMGTRFKCNGDERDVFAPYYRPHLTKTWRRRNVSQVKRMFRRKLRAANRKTVED